MKRSLLNTAILMALGLGAVIPASAQTVTTKTVKIDLCAGEYEIAANTTGLNNPDPILMWGYALGQDNGSGGCAGELSSPGPSILLPNTDEGGPQVYDLEVTLYNTLPRATSLVIPGTIKPLAPVMFTAPDGTSRVHSFDAEVKPGQSGTYSWTQLREGSYIYQSGTHQQVQVQMGLVGALMNDAYTGPNATSREAYPGLAYDSLFPIIYSEIDPAIHAGVALGEYDTDDMKSTVGYAPKYFGMTMDTITAASCPEDNYCVQAFRQSTLQGADIYMGMANGSKPVFRLFNGSTRIHTPTLIGANFDVIAEDGHVYPNLRREYAVTLPPLKTKDAIMDTTGMGAAGGTIRLTDSAMNLSNPAPKGIGAVYAGAQAHTKVIANGRDSVHAEFEVESHASYTPPVYDENSPMAARDTTGVNEGGSVDIDVIANDKNTTDVELTIVTQPRHGSLVATATGWTYTHDNGEASRDAFIYGLKQGGQVVSTAGVVINIAQTNDDPIAVDDSATLKVGQEIEIRVLDNDSDPDSRSLKITDVNVDGFTFGDVTFVDKAVIVKGTSEGTGTIVYSITDGQGGSASANISVTVGEGGSTTGDQYTNNDQDTTGEQESGVAPQAKDDYFSVAEGGVLEVKSEVLGVLANDFTNGGTVSMDEYPERGSVEMNGNGTFVYIHNGSKDEEDHFTYRVSNQWGYDKAEVKIKVTAKMNPPRVNDDKAKVKAGRSEVIDVLDNDKDRDSKVRNATIEIVDAPAHGTVSIGSDNKVTYTPEDGFTGNDEFTYRLLDDVTKEASRRNAKVKLKVR